MKNAATILIAIGLLLLAASVVGRFVGDPGFFYGRKVISLLLASNTAFVLAVLAKLYEKK